MGAILPQNPKSFGYGQLSRIKPLKNNTHIDDILNKEGFMNTNIIKSIFFILFAWTCLASANDECDGCLKKYSGSRLKCFDGSVSNPINTNYSDSELRALGQRYCLNRCKPMYASKCGLQSVLHGEDVTYYKKKKRVVSFTCYDNSKVKTPRECANRCSPIYITKCGVNNSKTELEKFEHQGSDNKSKRNAVR